VVGELEGGLHRVDIPDDDPGVVAAALLEFCQGELPGACGEILDL